MKAFYEQIPPNEKEGLAGCRKTVPNGDIECIWANAGVVPYKLCNFDFDCGNCAFDMMMRGGRELCPTRVTIRGSELCPSFFYHRFHTWAKVEGNANVRIGMDDLAQHLLGRILEVSFPMKGERLTNILIRCGRGVVRLVPPVQGYVVETNERLCSKPSLANQAPYESGWLALLRPMCLSRDLRRLFYGPAAQRWFAEEVVRLYSFFGDLVDKDQPEVGATLPDGGELNFGLLETLRPEEVNAVMEAFLGASSGE